MEKRAKVNCKFLRERKLHKEEVVTIDPSIVIENSVTVTRTEYITEEPLKSR